MTDTSVGVRPLVGRSGELTRLAGLTGVSGGGARGGAVLLAGDAGVGKTRLLGELVERARDADRCVLVGHCLDFGDSALPYLPFTEVFGELAASEPEVIAELAEELPAVRRLLPHQRVMTGEHEDVTHLDRSELFEAVYRALDRLAAARPLLVVVEDVHWADSSTRELLTFLFTRTFAAPVAIVASYRSDDLHRRHPLRRLVAEWSRLAGVTRFNLTGLGDADVRSLVRTLHPDPMPESDVNTIIARAEGNAFFTEELVGAAEFGRGTMPDDLAELMLIRLDRLDDDARTAVRASAGAGRRVSYALLSRVTDLEPERLDVALRQAVEHNVLVQAGDGYAFRHALLGEAVYEDLLPGERVRLHARYAEALRSREVGGTAADLARHARAAHDVETALRASIEAGDDAMSVGGPEEAAQHYETALELLAHLDESTLDSALDVDPVDLTVKAGDAITVAGSPHRAVGVVREQLLQRDSTLEESDRVRLLVALVRAAFVSETDVDVLPLTTEALSLVSTEPTPLRAQVLGVHALANVERQRDDEAVRWAEEAIRIGNELGLPQVVADARTTIGRLDARIGDPESSKRTLRSVIEHARETDNLVGEMKGLHQLGSVHHEAGEFDDALATYIAAYETARDAGRPWAPYGFDGRVLAALTAYIAGDWDHVKRITDVRGESPPPLAEANLAAIGMLVAAGRGHAKALDLSPSIRPWWFRDGMIAVQCGGAEIDLQGDRGDVDAAIETYEDIAKAVTSLQWVWFPARVRLSALLLGQLANHASGMPEGERQKTDSRIDQLIASADDVMRESRERRRPMGPEGMAWHARVQAEALRLRWLLGVDPPAEDELVASWEAAVASFEEFGHVFELARSRTRLASVLRAVGRRTDARQLADAARDVATALRAEPLLVELRAIGSTGHRGPSTDVTLTPREQEILALVAQGRSNAEIGRQLYISAKTVSVHVSNILSKLGASSRTEAAALARTQGLLP
ncbi:helix-turn-helix transcriptional regulator [Solicola gregarius]|uniref:AAA family ATPase n=1 Tax=Solicola gregarius TaxID=2908642 RepID=A0AA46TFN2_9ACTN|nr:helix-turn-helix transcriptional regulator [Solicola gregarius]UYM04295.1 AAA family ATPase [Solicola gregarius]